MNQLEEINIIYHIIDQINDSKNVLSFISICKRLRKCEFKYYDKYPIVPKILPDELFNSNTHLKKFNNKIKNIIVTDNYIQSIYRFYMRRFMLNIFNSDYKQLLHYNIILKLFKYTRLYIICNDLKSKTVTIEEYNEYHFKMQIYFGHDFEYHVSDIVQLTKLSYWLTKTFNCFHS